MIFHLLWVLAIASNTIATRRDKPYIHRLDDLAMENVLERLSIDDLTSWAATTKAHGAASRSVLENRYQRWKSSNRHPISPYREALRLLAKIQDGMFIPQSQWLSNLGGPNATPLNSEKIGRLYLQCRKLETQSMDMESEQTRKGAMTMSAACRSLEGTKRIAQAAIDLILEKKQQKLICARLLNRFKRREVRLAEDVNEQERLLLDQCTDQFGRTLLSIAIENMDLVGAKMLLEMELDANAKVHHVDPDGDEGEYDGELIGLAATTGSIPMVELLRRYGANINGVNHYNETPLNIATSPFHDRPELALHLARDSQVDVHKLNNIRLGAIHHAAETDQVNVVKALIDRGVHFKSRGSEYSSSPLHCAALYNSMDTMDLLLSKEAHVNDRDEDGKTPLHLAVEEKHIHAVRKLLEHEADRNAIDREGKTPIDLAADPEVLGLLLNN